jgi:hypothetical protein
VTWEVNQNWFCCSDPTIARTVVSSQKGLRKGNELQCTMQLEDADGAKSQVVRYEI